ncbi:hypothetical protein [Luteolibacter sp. AS25]|uniref:hypothetical protein n=1 Tax=Luteolibacter sp. AS25 TaxID=3135776 RepID=UPI00398BA1C3
MASDQELIQALKSAAKSITGKDLSSSDVSELLDIFNATRAQTKTERAYRALITFAIRRQKRPLYESKSASDNTDREVDDLDKTVTDWTPNKSK